MAASGETKYKMDRVIMNRASPDTVAIVQHLPPGQDKGPCYQCCYAPSFCPCCVICPCCNDPEYIVRASEDSKYIFLKETSIEWNDPNISFKDGSCCGIDPCHYRIQDNVHVVYYDDPLLTKIDDKTRCCDDFLTYCCGGSGDRIALRHTICLGCCNKAQFPFMCIPICCPVSCCPCAIQHNIYVQQGKGMEATVALRNARDEALASMARVEKQINEYRANRS